MEKYKNLKKGTRAGLIISIVLCIIALVSQIVSLINAFKVPDIVVVTSTGILISLAVILYSLVGYKKPHGNMLRMLFFVFAAYLGINALLEFAFAKVYVSGLCGMIAAITISYISGRLNKIEKNKMLFWTVGIVLLVGYAASIIQNNSFDVVGLISRCVPIFNFTALCFAYTARYEQHKAAGLEDK